MPFTRGVFELDGEAGTVEVTVGVPVTVAGVELRDTSSMSIRFVSDVGLEYVNATVWLPPLAYAERLTVCRL